MRNWWKESVIYQIYPRSFKDNNQDGIGDIRGIIEKIPYLKKLGIDIVWLSPIYQSPNDDNGYDISDYYNILPEFGNMEDFEEMLEKMHEAGLKLLMDLVVNHSSDEHTWFQESRKSKDNPYRDYYIWKAPAEDGGPPNNWRSFFSGSAWEFDELTGEYFLHLYTRKQPDLNWENPQVRQEIYKLMRFWLDKGIDGFRMDVIPLISKDLSFKDKDWSKIGADYGVAYANGPRVHEFLQEMNREVLSKYDMMSVGEGIGVSAELANNYVGSDRNELSMVFHFDHMFMDHGQGGRYFPRAFDLAEFMGVFEKWEEALGDKGWGTIYLGNHDFPRAVSRFGEEEVYREISAKLLATLLMTRKGTPTIYQGDEIGMRNTNFRELEEYRDVETFNAYRELVIEGDMTKDSFLKAARTHGRDHARTPILWENKAFAGFSEVEPWIKVSDDYPSLNVVNSLKERDSIFYYYQKLMQLRKEHMTWVYGETDTLKDLEVPLYGYYRRDEHASYLILLNFSSEAQKLKLDCSTMSFLYGNYSHKENLDTLSPWEARIYQL
ncbi:MAG: alpha-glucosidase [Bacteroidota bacterium]